MEGEMEVGLRRWRGFGCRGAMARQRPWPTWYGPEKMDTIVRSVTTTVDVWLLSTHNEACKSRYDRALASRCEAEGRLGTVGSRKSED